MNPSLSTAALHGRLVAAPVLLALVGSLVLPMTSLAAGPTRALAAPVATAAASGTLDLPRETAQGAPGIAAATAPTVTAIAAGQQHSCAVLANGSVWCWGRNTWGELGDGTTTDSPTPVQVFGIRTATAIAAGDYEYTCALLADGTVRCWGLNGYGRLGDGTPDVDRHTPIAVTGISTATAITAGGDHVCALLADHTIRCWGGNYWGQLGHGTQNLGHLTPVPVSGISTAVAIAAGREHTCAVLADGGARCWGWNGDGQLGDGTDDYRLTPVKVSVISTATAISAGWDSTCALLADDTARCWGQNDWGQLGDGTTTDRPTPVAVSGISTASAIAAGSHTCAVLVDGSVRCWGLNQRGALGDGTTTNRHTPVAVSGISTATAISAGGGWGHSCAVLTDGSARCWGANEYGQLGDGTTTGRLTPVAVDFPTTPPKATMAAPASPTTATTLRYAVTFSGPVTGLGTADFTRTGTATGCTVGTPSGSGAGYVVRVTGCSDGTVVLALRANTVADLVGNPGPVATVTAATVTIDRTRPTAVSAIAAGAAHTCAILANGTVRCWGDNYRGQLGDGTKTDRLTPVVVSGISTATAIAAADEHTCAVLADGTARCWGRNYYGQLGDGTKTDRLTPVAVSGISTATAITAGEDHTCAVLADAVVRCWGRNYSGQLGDGTTTDRLTPVAVTGIGTATAIATGGYHTCAVLGNGTVRCWGSNGSGQLGDGTTTNRITAVVVAGIGTAVAIAASASSHTCAVLVGGTARCWGENYWGQLGDGTTTDRLTPVAVSGISTAVLIAAAGSHTCTRLAVGSLRCWGDNYFGQLGDGTTTWRRTPVAVSGISTATRISAGRSHTCALLANRTVRCWGANGSGQLGDRTTTNRLTPVAVRFDTAAPTATAPAANLRTGVSLSGSAIPVRLTWKGADTGGSGVASYALARSTDGGAWTTVSARLTTPAASLTVPSSGTVRFRVRAVDRAGNVGAWATGPTLSPRLVQETSTAITYAGTWTTGSSTAYSGGTVKYAKAAGASASYTFTGRSIALVTTKGPTRGQVKVYVGGVLAATVNCYSATNQFRVLAWQMTWATSGTRTIKLVVVGTAGRPRVDLDAFAVLR